MRIIGGSLRGRRFEPPAKNWPTRPTTDLAREALFNILENEFDFEKLRALDLFSGTGSHAYEFVSRGCEDVTCIDSHGPCVSFIEKVAETLNVSDNIHALRADVLRYLQTYSGAPFGYVFADPPYDHETAMREVPKLVLSHPTLLKPGGWLVLEHSQKHRYDEQEFFLKKKQYGQTCFSIFEKPGLEDEVEEIAD